MLEWLLRKLFGIKKPKSSEKLSRDDASQEEGGQEAQDDDQRAEPILGEAAAQPLVPSNQRMTNGSLETPLTAVRADGQQQRPAHELRSEEQDAKVHIFNFRAWFYADPVKAALTLGLAFLSWLATYTGMLELIQANTGSLDIGSRVAIGFAVMMLMLMILYLLDSLYSGGTPTWLKPIFVFGYLFLTLISVGFGFGFYWKYLEAQTEATRSAESAVSQVQVSLQIGQSRLEQLQSTFGQLTNLSTTKATQEREHGNSCPNSKPGEGPRMRLRDSDSQKFAYATEYITGRASKVKTDLDALNVDLKKVVSREASTVGADGTRNKFLRALGRKLDLTIARFNTLRTDPQLLQFRDNFDKRASTTVFPNGRGGTFRCPDVQLQTALRGVVRAIDDIPEIKNPKISAVEGSEAIVEAFRRLAVTLAALPTLKLPPSAEELRKARKQAISAGRKVEVSNVDAGLSKRDYIPLSAAVFVDLCILLISLNRRYNNFEKLQRSVASAKAGEVGNTVLDIFEAHKNKISQEMLEIFHHAEFEHGRDYYLAVPLIKGSTKAIINERLHAKQDEISRSQHEALDHKIEILDTKQQKLTVERTEFDSMKLQLTNHQNRLLGIHNQLRSNLEQLQLSSQGEPADAFKSRPEVTDIDTRMAKISHDKARCGDELLKLDRLMNGNFQRIEQVKTEIGLLKEQRTGIHKQEEVQLKGQLESHAEHDLAKEARFLSNLCISLEANDILHLASIWPFQRQVRAQLKKHNSRYYAPERHYRVYRFRKVADTQSQMVLDLIMEASKRARSNEELVEDEQPASLTAVPSLQQKLEDSMLSDGGRVDGNNKTELTELREMVLNIQKEAGLLRDENESLREEASYEPASPIDRDATILEEINIRQLSQEEQRKMNSALGSALSGASGLGVSKSDLADLVKTKANDHSSPSDRSHPAGAETAPMASEVKTPRKMVQMLGGIFSAKPSQTSPDTPKVAVTQTNRQETASTVHSDDLPLVATPNPVQDNELRGQVNEDSLMPAPATGQDNQQTPVVSSGETEVARSDRESSERALAHLSRLKDLDKLVQNLDEDQKLPEKPVLATEQPEFAAFGTNASTEHKDLTDPVTADPVNPINQDRQEVKMAPLTATRDDEPSEVDNTDFGPIPKGYGSENDKLDEASEDMGTQSIAKKFAPKTTET